MENIMQSTGKLVMPQPARPLPTKADFDRELERAKSLFEAGRPAWDKADNERRQAHANDWAEAKAEAEAEARAGAVRCRQCGTKVGQSAESETCQGGPRCGFCQAYCAPGACVTCGEPINPAGKKKRRSDAKHCARLSCKAATDARHRRRREFWDHYCGFGIREIGGRCQECGKQFWAMRSTKKYCGIDGGSPCRQRAYRRRHKTRT
jgi:hypothetical protein